MQHGIVKRKSQNRIIGTCFLCRCSSHRSQLNTEVVLYEDSGLDHDNLYHGVGYSPGFFGHQVVDWLPLNVSKSMPPQGSSGDLGGFSSPRPGRLTSSPLRSVTSSTAAACATECVKDQRCLSFSYNQFLRQCEVQAVTDGASAERREDADFQTYERLGKAYTASLRYTNLTLHHGMVYYVNADVTNVLGYHSTLTSGGTMVDFTPPELGVIRNASRDVVVADGCGASILQRCVNAEQNVPNHR